MTQRLATVGFLVLAIASSVPVTAFGSDHPDASTPLSLAEWYKTMIETPPGPKGCFEVEHPNTAWQEVPCAPGVELGPIGVPPTVPGPSAVDSGTPTGTQVLGLSAVGTGAAAPGPLAVGGGVSGFVVSVGYPNDHLAFADGYFIQVIGVTSISSSAGDNNNSYSLQLNTNTFSTAACNGSADPANCSGWQQFVYQNSQDTGIIKMEYWLLHYGSACDTNNGWAQDGDSCVKDSAYAYVEPQTISNLSTLYVLGAASLSQDYVYFRRAVSGIAKLTAISQDSVLGLAQGWNFAEYNIFADGSPHITATFNPGSSILVAMEAMAVGPGQPPYPYPPDPTTCLSGHSITAEWNSLNLFGGCCFESNHYWFFESNTDATNRPACATDPAKPTIQASINYLNGSTSQINLGWTNGNGEATAVFMAAAPTGAPAPVDATVYLQNAADPSMQGWQNATFGQGNQIGTSGWYCVYNGLGSGLGGGAVQVDGLQPGTIYRVMVVSYNGYSVGLPAYLTTTTSNNPANWIREASNVTATSCASSNGSCMTLGWQNGNGNATAVFMAQNGTGNPLIDSLVWDGYQYTDTLYHAPGSQSSIFGQGTQLPGGNWYCVYNGTTTSATVSGLQPGATYRVAAFSYTGAWNNPTFLRNPWDGWIVNPISFHAPPIGSSGEPLQGFDVATPLPALPLGGLVVLAMALGVAGRSRLSKRSKSQ